MARKSREESLQTRDQILDAAEKLFLERGVSCTSLQQIAQAAGVTRGAIYWHFAGKLDLLQALMDRARVPMDDLVSRAESDTASSPLERARRIMTDTFERVTTDPQLQRILEIVFQKIELVGEIAAMRDRYLECMGIFTAAIERQLKAAAASGEITLGTASPHDMARALQALGDGLLAQWLLFPRSFDLTRALQAGVDALLAGLRVPAPTTAENPSPARRTGGLRLAPREAVPHRRGDLPL